MQEITRIPKKWLIIFGSLTLVVLVAIGLYFYQQAMHKKQLMQNPTYAAKKNAEDLVDRVGRLTQLPQDETPSIATVTDVTKLQNQPFFAKAKNGDKVLIYTKSREAILYDPVANIVVNIAPLHIGGPTPTPKPTP